MSTEVEPELPFSPLVADIISASFAMTASTANALIDSLTRQNADLRARQAAVEAQFAELLDRPYAPSESAIRAALYPPPEFIDLFRENEVS